MNYPSFNLNCFCFSFFQAKSRVPISACFRGLMWHSGTKFPNKPVKEQSVSKCYNEQQEKSVYFAGINSYMIASESLTAFNAFLIIAALESAPTVHVLYPLGL
jgi:hypothetical protein